jgi:hypothetical protein
VGRDGGLRVGVALAAGPVPAWTRRCIDALAVEPGVRLTALVRPEAMVARRSALSPWAIVERVARRRSDALRPMAPPPVLERLPAVGATGGGEPDLDVVIDLSGAEGPAGPLARRARLGVWRFEFGPERVGAGGAVGLGDVVERRPTADIRLLAHTADGGVTVLRQGTVRTLAHSWPRHRDHLLLHGLDWPALSCRDALAGRPPGPAAPPPRAAKPRRGRLARLAGSTVLGHAARLAHFVPEAQWHVGVVDAPIEAFLRPRDLPPPRWLPGPPRHAFYADPFPWPRRQQVIVERFGLRDRVGTLCTVDLSRPGGPPRPVAQPGHHMSYPYVVEDDGEAYCTPETAALGQVGLYRLVGEPLRLEKVTTLVDGIAAVDPTVTCHDGRWWLFFTDGGRDADTDLHAWYADELVGPWRAHGRNPVKVDVRSSRPAGTPFTCDGNLFRPAMDNTGWYGGRVVVNRVVELTPDDFTEEVAVVVPPFPGPFGRGIHTIAAAGQSTVVDGKRLRLVPSALPAKLRAHRERRPAG